MARRQMPDAEFVRKLLKYDPDTGKLFWRTRTPDMFDPSPYRGGTRSAKWACNLWNTKFAEKEAGSNYAEGYLGVSIHRQKWLAHRIAWLIHYGTEPDEIDHINGERADNRITNLREVTRSENNCNARRQSNNTSGVTGVTWCAYSGRWKAFVKLDGKNKHIGRFDTIAEAAAARKRVERELGFHANHGRE